MRCKAFLVVLMTLGLNQCDGRLVNLGQSAAVTGGRAGSAGASHRGGSDNGGFAGNGEKVSIGGSGSTSGGAAPSLSEPQFENVTLVEALAATLTGDKDENPTLTSDLLELYFYSNRGDGEDSDDDVWVSKRSNVSAPWSTPILLEVVSTTGSETSPAVSANGLAIWVGVDLDGGLGGRDIWRYDRSSRNEPFGATATNEPGVNSTEDDVPRPPGNLGRTMPLASRRDTSTYQTYFATRDANSGQFGSLQVATTLVPDVGTMRDAFLTNDGLTLYFAGGPDSANGDIYVATRRSVAEGFGSPAALSALNSAQDDRDPWVSDDGSIIFFVSDRSGSRRIYQATRVRE